MKINRKNIIVMILSVLALVFIYKSSKTDPTRIDWYFILAILLLLAVLILSIAYNTCPYCGKYIRPQGFFKTSDYCPHCGSDLRDKE